MLFNSLIFLLFGVIFFLFWSVIRKSTNLRYIYLIFASFFFYGWWDWRFIFLIVGSGLIDFFAGLGFQRYPKQRRKILIASIVGNIGSLGAFKYSGFVIENLDWLFQLVGLEIILTPSVPDFMLIVPIGISFYTFQSMSYTIDIYRGQLQPTRNIFHFFAYLSMFPQLVAGPIVRARDLLPQLKTSRPVSEIQRYDGLTLIVNGFFKKVVIADNLAPVVNHAFAATTVQPSSIYWWLVITMFAFQIYCDFSGYSDIARGLAKWMGYDFQLNFNHPYVSRSLREFWTRWHISLSTWFRDYLFIPLGGSRLSHFTQYRNLWITFLISGLWHGAAWTFIIWAAVHALFITIENITAWPERMRENLVARLLSTAIILVQIWVAWVFFRAESLGQATEIIGQMFAFDLRMFSFGDFVLFMRAMFFMALIAGREAFVYFNLNQYFDTRTIFYRLAEQIVLAAMIAACVFLRGPGNAFIYFQF